MFTDEGKLILFVIIFLMGMYASGYFMGWGRNKLSVKIFDKMLESMDKVRYWKNRLEENQEWYNDLINDYKELKEYTLEQVGAELVPTKFGGELE
jgi:hypothetical protein